MANLIRSFALCLVTIIVCCALNACKRTDADRAKAKQVAEEILRSDAGKGMSDADKDYLLVTATWTSETELYNSLNKIVFEKGFQGSIGSDFFAELYLITDDQKEIGELRRTEDIDELRSKLNSLNIQTLAIPSRIVVLIAYGGVGGIPFAKSEIRYQILVEGPNSEVVVNTEDSFVVKEGNVKVTLGRCSIAKNTVTLEFNETLPKGKYKVTATIYSAASTASLHLVREFEI